MSLEPNHVDSRGDKATRTACPSLASCQRVAATGADRAIVTALEKAAARSNDVLERAAVDADLQYAAVKGVLKRIIVAESKSGIFKRINRNRQRVETLVAHQRGIINPRGIWRRVGWWNRISGIGRLP